MSVASEPLNGAVLPPPRRVILLGASNVRRGLGVALDTARRVLGGPLDVSAAYGLGRSYGQCRSVLGRALPGIVDCGLWQALERQPAVPTAALVTDIGNDLLFEVPVPEIAAWVEACVDRLLGIGAEPGSLVLTGLPLCSISSLSTARFLIFRSILFPRCRFTLAKVRELALDLDERLRHLARSRGLVLTEHRPEWYGLDPIHVRGRCLTRAWQELLSSWSAQTSEDLKTSEISARSGSLRRWLYLQRLLPECHWYRGRERRQVQPAGVLADGTTVSFY
jgi:hypothetical protein